ncbi:MAG: bacteriohemerythrin [Terracidiphilus sp.]|jgi:hemerythrin
MGEPFAAWTEELSVGVAALDDDHRKLIAILNELHDGIMAGHKKEVLASVLGHLVDYAKFHFANEEEFFARINYPFAPAHKMEHSNFVNRITNLRERFKSAPVAMLDLELMSFLRNWLVTHIQGSDKQYGPHLNAKGIS